MKKIMLSLGLGLIFSLGFGVGGALAQGETLNNNCLATPNDNGCRAGLPTEQYQMLLDEMLLQPEPSLIPLAPNTAELERYHFRRLINPDGTNIYNAPGGQITDRLDPGFNFVTVVGVQEGWVQINRDQWVLDSDTQVARPSTYAGVLLAEREPRYQLAWVLVASHPAPYPGAEQDTSLPRIARYTRINIFASLELNGWRWYLIAPDTWIIQTSVAKVNFIERPEEIKGRWVAVDLYEQVLVAYDEYDTPIFATLISSGLRDWATNEGTFQTWARISSGSMSGAAGQAEFYRLENVPWTLYFDNDIGLHGAYWHDGFGYRRSRGCVNMSITDSHWLYHWTLNGGYDKPFVHVFSSGEYVQ